MKRLVTNVKLAIFLERSTKIYLASKKEEIFNALREWEDVRI